VSRLSPQEALKRRGIEYRETRHGKFTTECPQCGQGYCNVKVGPDEATWYCHDCKEGGRESLNGQNKNGEVRELDLGPIKATYDYTDENDKLLFQALRFEPINGPKQFRQRTGPDQKKWSIKGVRIVPFRLPELLEDIAADRTIFIPEGEKDVLTLRKRGIPATCNPMGAGKWWPEFNKILSGADVVICCDNDAPGRDHAHMVARNLRPVAKRLRVLDLAEHWPEIEASDDVTDWFEAGHTVEELHSIVAKLPDAEPSKAGNGHDTHHSHNQRDQEGEARPPAFSDDALALRFVDEHEETLRYVPSLGKWLRWDGKRWCLDERLIAYARMRKVCRDAAAECKANLAKLIASNKTAAAAERFARCDQRIVVTIDELDADPWLFNSPRGTIDLRTAQERSHKQMDLLTKIAGVAPGPSCPTPVWDAFLARVTGNQPELSAYLQRVAGYSLTGSTQEHALFFLYGLGANGKTTFLNAITACAGDYHRAASIETFTASSVDRHPTDLAGLRGARLVTAIETEEGRRWAESRIKALTGGDKISARFMRQDFFEYTPHFKLIIAGNHKPGLRSVDEAIRRRFNLIPFTVTIPPDERDGTLPERLKAELPGIMQWMIDGCMDWQERGLDPPEIVTQATAAYLEAEDAMAAWIDECCERDSNAWESSTDLFASWNTWATKAGEYVGSMKRFAGAFENKHFTPARSSSGARGFRGVRLLRSYSSFDWPHGGEGR
jgi:putative DNA primase/helicase